MEAREPLRELRQALRAVLARVREGEPGEGREAFELPRFWDALGQTFKVTSQEATKLSLAFSRPPLTSAEDCQKLSEDVQNAILAVATVYYWLPKGQGTTLRKMVRDATTEVVEGMIQLTETILSAPLESLSQEQLISTGGVWEACEQVSNLPRDNQAAVVSTLTACLGVVKDALEEMEHALVEGQDPYSDIMEDEELGFRGNRDTYWSEADRKLLSSCMGLMKASKACLKKVLSVVKAYGKADSPEQIAQLDDVADIANEISPSVDELALSMYPPMNQLAVRLNAAKLASVLKKVLEITNIIPEIKPVYLHFVLGELHPEFAIHCMRSPSHYGKTSFRSRHGNSYMQEWTKCQLVLGCVAAMKEVGRARKLEGASKEEGTQPHLIRRNKHRNHFEESHYFLQENSREAGLHGIEECLLTLKKNKEL